MTRKKFLANSPFLTGDKCSCPSLFKVWKTYYVLFHMVVGVLLYKKTVLEENMFHWKGIFFPLKITVNCKQFSKLTACLIHSLDFMIVFGDT